jgi:hypothetical protein
MRGIWQRKLIVSRFVAFCEYDDRQRREKKEDYSNTKNNTESAARVKGMTSVLTVGKLPTSNI